MTQADFKAQLSWVELADDNKTIDKMLSWVHEAINTLPTADMRAAIKWNCLTGLRPNESLASLRLIKILNSSRPIMTQTGNYYVIISFQRFSLEEPRLLMSLS
jgi:hypothetical protein